MNNPSLNENDSDSEQFDSNAIDQPFAHSDSLNDPVTCWRCESSFDNSLARCPKCLASNKTFSGAAEAANTSNRFPSIVRVVWAFGAMALVSIVSAVISSATIQKELNLTEEGARTQLSWISVVEIIDTVIVLIAISSIRITPKWPQTTQVHSGFVWLLAVPLLIVTLCLNFGYHFWLRTALGLEVEVVSLTAFPGLWPWLLVTICLQPAIVEEVFFRRVALGAALEVISPRQAILVTSLLFALAHLGAPLSIPVLAMLGAVLGMLRLASGGLLLPIVFHFLHNLFVLLLEKLL